MSTLSPALPSDPGPSGSQWPTVRLLTSSVYSPGSASHTWSPSVPLLKDSDDSSAHMKGLL